MTNVQSKLAKRSLLPLFLFVGLFLGTGLYLQYQGVAYAFYQVPSPITVIPAIILAVILNKEKINHSIDTFIKGAGDSNIITMCMIYLLAGAFSAVAKATGGVDSVVNAGLSVIPLAFLLPGLFVVTAIIATAMGTSMGTIAAVAPIAYALAQTAQLDLPLVAGVVLSGAMFGDNLSIISDTTIAATRSQGSELKDKFKENLIFALPAAVIILIFLSFQQTVDTPLTIGDYSIVSILPYFTILALAIAGVNVFLVLLLGILFAALIGTATMDYGLSPFVNDVYAGFTSMQEIFLLSMLIGGLSEIIKTQGGLDYVCHKVQTFVKKLTFLSANAAQQLAIGMLAFLSNLCIANNVVAIVVSGGIAKKLAVEKNIAPKRSASVLDIFACVSQGLVPFGAQALLLGATFQLSPLTIVSNSYYAIALAGVTILVLLKR